MPTLRPAKPRRRTAHEELCVVGDFGAHGRERESGHGTRDAADGFVAVENLVTGMCGLDSEHAQAPVHLAAIVLAGDRLLPRIAPFCETDVRLVEAGFRREDAVVDLRAPARDPGFDPPPLVVLLAHLVTRRSFADHFRAAEHAPRFVLLR